MTPGAPVTLVIRVSCGVCTTMLRGLFRVGGASRITMLSPVIVIAYEVRPNAVGPENVICWPGCVQAGEYTLARCSEPSSPA